MDAKKRRFIGRFERPVRRGRAGSRDAGVAPAPRAVGKFRRRDRRGPARQVVSPPPFCGGDRAIRWDSSLYPYDRWAIATSRKRSQEAATGIPMKSPTLPVRLLLIAPDKRIAAGRRDRCEFMTVFRMTALDRRFARRLLQRARRWRAQPPRKRGHRAS
jgi:hypothetical protein